MAEEVKIKNRKKLRKERVHVSLFFSFLSVRLGQSSEVSESAVTVETFFDKKALLSTIKINMLSSLTAYLTGVFNQIAITSNSV